jgi:hypothetical protein
LTHVNGFLAASDGDLGVETCRASFGFVSKYQKGRTVPTGETQFQFEVAGFRFHSVSYEWLVVSSAKAQYKAWAP